MAVLLQLHVIMKTPISMHEKLDGWTLRSLDTKCLSAYHEAEQLLGRADVVGERTPAHMKFLSCCARCESTVPKIRRISIHLHAFYLVSPTRADCLPDTPLGRFAARQVLSVGRSYYGILIRKICGRQCGVPNMQVAR